jgi:uncharacterized membrane protein YdjX (TVP38/TMEM64 family)
MNRGQRRTIALSILAALAAATIVLLLRDVVTLEQLKARREELIAFIGHAPILFISLFIIAFAVIASFAPGAAVLKVAAGALFGLWGGGVIALVATLLSASIGFVAARYLLRHWVERRHSERVAAINRGVREDGVMFLLALRLNPLIPFFLINFGMGLTRMRLTVFAATSFFGLIPASFVYANAGTELARIETPSDVLSIRLIGSLVLLSLMPLIGRAVAKRLRRQRGDVAELPGED